MIKKCVEDVRINIDQDSDGTIGQVSRTGSLMDDYNMLIIFIQAEFVENAVKSKFIYNMFIAE